MASILWIVIGSIGCLWAASMLVTGALALGAHRGHSGIVMDDPWETERGQRDLARFREAMARAQVEAAAREADFSQWDRDFARPGPQVDGSRHVDLVRRPSCP